jgi:hypothetical protein
MGEHMREMSYMKCKVLQCFSHESKVQKRVASEVTGACTTGVVGWRQLKFSSHERGSTRCTLYSSLWVQQRNGLRTKQEYATVGREEPRHFDFLIHTSPAAPSTRIDSMTRSIDRRTLSAYRMVSPARWASSSQRTRCLRAEERRSRASCSMRATASYGWDQQRRS